jgi:signal peptidase I
MEPALLPGDCILVNKWVMGGRVFNLWKALNKKEVKIYRLPSLSKIKRNDILVFNFPYPKHWDSIGFDVMKYYVKRCVALPGDTFEIKNARYRVHGCSASLGNLKAQKSLLRLLNAGRAKYYGVVERTFPHDSLVNWNIKDFGPLYIPAKGDYMHIGPLQKILYKNIIEWEQKKKLSLVDNEVLLGDSVITRYRFKENYYFVAGDKVENSRDSRYWGLLPEPFIVGKAVRIWKSVDKETGGIRWNRILKGIS